MVVQVSLSPPANLQPRMSLLVTTLTDRDAALTYSYEEERKAMQLAVDWIKQHFNQSMYVALYTDMALLGLSRPRHPPPLMNNTVAMPYIQYGSHSFWRRSQFGTARFSDGYFWRRPVWRQFLFGAAHFCPNFYLEPIFLAPLVN